MSVANQVVRRASAALLVVVGAVAATVPAGAAGATTGSAGSAGSQGIAPHAAGPLRLPQGASLLGPVTPTTQITVDVTLRPRDPAALAAFIHDLSTPGDPEYRHYLARGQFAERFGPTRAQVAAVTSWLRSAGLHPGAADPAGTSIPVTADAAALEHAFGTGLRQVRLASGRIGRVATSTPLVPSAVSGTVQGVLGLDDLVQLHSHLARPSAPAPGTARPSAVLAPRTSGPTPCATATNTAVSYNGYTANQLATAYGFNSLYSAGWTGSGLTVGIYELEPYSSTDITTYKTCYGLTNPVTDILVDGGAGTGVGSGEAALDIEDVAGLAPGSAIEVYTGPNGGTGQYDTYAKMISDDTSQVISTSWGICEAAYGSSADAAMGSEQTLFQQAATQGQTIFSAAGDDGSEDCYGYNGSTALGVDDPAAQPNVTGVGGTDLTSPSFPPAEKVWNEGAANAGAGGGGISTVFTMPSWQSGPGVHNSYTPASACPVSSGTGTTSCREVPDVTASADPYHGYVIAYSGSWTVIGGTSAAAPLWSAMAAVVDQGVGASAGTGQWNSVVTAGEGCSTNDVLTGNNDYRSTNSGAYPATPNYDMASGWGSPVGPALLAELKTACPVVTGVTPNTGSTAGGNSVTISGSGFTGVTAVDFGANAATVTGSTPTSITVTAPAAAGPGVVDVRVTGSGGTSAKVPADAYTYVNTTAVTSISPSSGPTAGGTTVTITGSGFTGATAVSFGATPATSFTVISATSITAVSPAGSAGTVDVTVTDPIGTTAIVSADRFTYMAAPTVTSISPTSGPASGGTTVTITGTGFTGATAVSFGASPAASYTVVSATSITAVSPAGSAGAVDVVVSGPGGISSTGSGDLFTFLPAVTSISPTSGPASGGTTVTITGTGFTGATAVSFGATPAAGYTVISATSITAVSPAESAGTVDVTVADAGGTSATVAGDRFTYMAAPTVTSISPTSGPASGGTTVTITGTGFTGATAVAFGSSPAASFTVVSATSITAVSPAESAGTVDVVVSGPGGISSTGSGDLFTFVPAVTSISPTSGPTAGGTTVTITGTGFTGATAVDFGATPAAGFTVDSDTSITAVSPAGSVGTVDVTVADAGGTSAAVAGDRFTYMPAPAVTSISPTSGPASGGTTVTITGTNFTGATAVSFGSSPAASYTVVSATSITAVSPAGSVGTVDVVVSGPGGISSTGSGDLFTFLPVVTSISPTSGPTAGGTSVTITGTGFTGATAVDFGATPATSFSVVSDTSITVVSPAGSAGTVDVTVTDAGGTSAAVAGDRFTFVPAPTVTSISPTSGPASGGTTVTITGTGFTGATAVSFGASPAASYTVVSDTSITAVSPAGSAGTVDVVVSGPGGISSTGSGDRFTFLPVVTSISPTSGPTAGGTSVTITGSGFTGATGVSFGATPATSFSVVSDTSITVVSPAGSAGTVDVTVTDAGGTSAAVAGDRFTFVPAPTVTSIFPTSGPASGGTTVTITGTGFTGTTAVSFGATPAAGFTVVSATSITAVSPAGSAGAVDVVVSGPGGISSTGAGDLFTFLPAVTSISPTSGPASGGTTVTITGTGFTGATAVDFGATPATSFSVVSDTSITAVSPAGSAGTVDVTVADAGGTSAAVAGDRFTFVPAPTVTSISPSSGPTAGGTTVTITGTGFTGTTAVSFGATPAAGFTVVSATSITAVSPAGSAGTVDVTVADAGGTSAAVAGDRFTFVPAPTVTSISPTSGPASGGTTVTITGAGFTGATAVAFGSSPAASYTVVSATSITAVSPAGSAGAVDVVVSGPGGISSIGSGDRFTYVPAPAVTSISPPSGPASGGTTVTITGTGFTGATAVDFGATPATSFTVVSATSITAVSPSGSAGTVDVVVTGPGGTSPTGSADRFTFLPVVTSISPTSGPTGGGTTVTITGTGFTGATAVDFGATPATSFSVVSDTSITAVSPAGSAGTINVTVVDSGGTSAAVAGDRFTFGSALAVSGLSPASGSMRGGTTVVASGTGLGAIVSVTVGGRPAALVSVTATAVTFVTPPSSTTGAVTVVLSSPGGSVSTSYTYVLPPPGYWLVASDGGIFAFGSAGFYGSTGAITLNKPIVGMAATPDGKGYWLVASDGGIFAFGDAAFHGSTGGYPLNKPIVGMATTPDGGGYWLVASDGGIFAFGDAGFHGSTGGYPLNKPIVGMATTPDGGGYWLVASDGGIFAFGDAGFHGSTGGYPLNKPIVGMATTPDGGGYWLVASDGGIFAFGDAGFHGSTGGYPLNKPIVGMSPTPDGKGYWLVASDGGIFAFGDAGFYGSTGAMTLNKPIDGMTGI